MILPFRFERIVLHRAARRCPTYPARHLPFPLRRLATVVHPAAHTIPPNHPATIGNLTTFALPSQVHGTEADYALGEQIVETWRKDGIFQVQMSGEHAATFKEAYRFSKKFFQLPFREKAKHVDDQSFSGYVASGEELTDGIADYSEIFTVTKDLPLSDPRVQQKWPCHGPCPWPDRMYAEVMDRVMAVLGQSGETLLKLTALGLKLRDPNTFTNMTEDGWHHMRILRFPHVDKTNGKGKPGRGIGSHTDYGLLVLASQDDVGGLFVRPSVKGETIRNWEKSAAGHQENDEKWTYVPPVENVLTVFPGKGSLTIFLMMV
jgi:isopenicillin N synthase-like dioxygenase